MMTLRNFGSPVFVSKCCNTFFRTYTREQVKLKFPTGRVAKPSTVTSPSLPYVVDSYLTATAGATIKTQDPRMSASSECLSRAQEDSLLTPDTPAGTGALNLVSQPVSCGDHLSSVCSAESANLGPLLIECSGCGSPLHCRSADAPGFVPSDKFLNLQSELQEKVVRRGYVVNRIPIICHRCMLLMKHQQPRTAFSPSASSELIASVIGDAVDATVLLIVDMTNLPHSAVPGLGTILACHKYILIGNKVDQLPIDGLYYLQRWNDALLETARCTCKINPSHIVHTALTSALTGFGILPLVDFLLGKKSHSMSPMFIVGGTNVGKSSIFNRLLMSDLCKSEAREAVHRATVSSWPGTTAGVLKFPLSRMDYTKRALRDEVKFYHKDHTNKPTTAFAPSCGFKYLTPQPVFASDPKNYTAVTATVQNARGLQIDLSKMPTYVRNDVSANEEGTPTLEASDFELNQLTKKHLSNITVDVGRWSGDKSYRLLTTLMDPRNFHERAWCSDTPGFVCSDQILNYLPPNELKKIESGSPYGSKNRSALEGPFGTSGKVLVPRNFVMRPGLSLLLGRLSRLDVLQAPGPVYFTTFSLLPVHIVEQSEVENYLAKYATDLGPGHCLSDESDPSGPFGTLPPLQSRVLDPIETQTNLDSSTVDIVLSGAGWIGVVGLNRRPSKHGAAVLDGDAVTDSTGQDCNDLESPGSECGSMIHLCAWTPGALGISVRKPALIPYAIKRRKRRFFMTREFSYAS